MKLKKFLLTLIAGGVAMTLSAGGSSAGNGSPALSAADSYMPGESGQQLVIRRPPANKNRPQGPRPSRIPPRKNAQRDSVGKPVSVHNQRPQKEDNRHKKTVLYKLGREILDEGEFTCNLKLGSNNFVAVTVDTLNLDMFLVVNGEKRLKADEIVIINVDVDNISDMSYYYRIGEEYFANIGGRKEGPFEEISLAENFMPKIYHCRDMGNDYMRDSDGALYARSLYNGEPGKRPLIMTSTDGRRQVKFYDDMTSYELDGRHYKLTLDEGGYLEFNRPFYISNQGIIYGSGAKSTGGYGFYEISAGRPTEIEDYAELTDLIDLAKEKDGCVSSFALTDYLKEELVDWDADDPLYFSFSDDAERHSFESSLDYNFVTIDGKEIKSAPPFLAFFYDDQPVVAWFTIEDNAIVKHTYNCE